MNRAFSLPLAALLLLTAAAPPADPAATFGARESVEHISLSPSGNKVAFIEPTGGQGARVYTVDLVAGGEPKLTLVADGKPERVTSCGWVSETRLVCSVYLLVQGDGQIYPVSRIVAVDEGGGNPKLLTRRSRMDDAYTELRGGGVIDWLPGDDGAVLMGRHYVPEVKPGTYLEDKREGYGVDRVDTRTLSSKTVEPPRANAIEYISDGRGQVRIMGIGSVDHVSGYDTGRVNYQYRRKGDKDWKPLSTYHSLSDEGFNPYAVDPDLDVVYGMKRHDGRFALFSRPLDGSGAEKLVYGHPQVDVDGLVRIGRGGRVVGTTFATDKREAVYFDKGLEAMAASLNKALPGLPLIRFVGASADESKLLLWAGSDTDPGRYYLFDKGAKRLNELMLSRPQLENVPLAPMKPITYRAADGTMVPGYLTLPPGKEARGLPGIVMPHGGPGSRDEWGFDWLVQYFASRGYAVLQPNFRGSAGYGQAWFQKNGFQSWKTAVGDVNDAGRWLVKEGIADPSKLGIFGWSYGGYAALQSGVLDPNLFKAVVAVAPVTDLSLLVEETRRWSHHRIVADMIGTGPHVREGSPADNAGKIQAPVLMFHGDFDRNVGVAHARRMQDKLKAANARSELVVYPGLDHYLDDSTARTDMLRRSDAFLRAALKVE